MENPLKRSWFCTCGWTFDEEVGEYSPIEGTYGGNNRYCSNCKSYTDMEWYVIENTDPDDELEEASIFCLYCGELKPNYEVKKDHENFAYPVCNTCIKEHK